MLSIVTPSKHIADDVKTRIKSNSSAHDVNEIVTPTFIHNRSITSINSSLSYQTKIAMLKDWFWKKSFSSYGGFSNTGVSQEVIDHFTK